jgi:hypothetical protein
MSNNQDNFDDPVRQPKGWFSTGHGLSPGGTSSRFNSQMDEERAEAVRKYNESLAQPKAAGPSDKPKTISLNKLPSSDRVQLNAMQRRGNRQLQTGKLAGAKKTRDRATAMLTPDKPATPAAKGAVSDSPVAAPVNGAPPAPAAPSASSVPPAPAAAPPATPAAKTEEASPTGKKETQKIEIKGTLTLVDPHSNQFTIAGGSV